MLEVENLNVEIGVLEPALCLREEEIGLRPLRIEGHLHGKLVGGARRSWRADDRGGCDLDAAN